MSFSGSSENTLWNECLANDLLHFLTSRIKCPETAADLMQETCLRLHLRSNEAPLDNARALAFRIALNLAIDYQRKMTVRKRHGSEAEFESILENVSNESTQPDRALIAQEQLNALRQALDELPLNCRTAFYLHSLDGLSYSEIAVRMGISKSMVNKLLSQAMTYCAQKIE